MIDDAVGTLSGKNVVIVGGSGQMGRAIARAAARQGARIVLLGRTRERLAATSDWLDDENGKVRWSIADATDPASLEAALAQTADVDHIVTSTSSGVAPMRRTIPTTNLASFEAICSRLWAAYNVMHLAPRYLRPHGSITLISGSSGKRPQIGLGVFGALHGAIEALGRSAAIELAPLRVNTVSPGGIGVPPTNQLLPHHSSFDELAAAVLALMNNPAITGAVLDVDAGEFLGSWSGS